jgi:hypothetical protein
LNVGPHDEILPDQRRRRTGTGLPHYLLWDVRVHGSAREDIMIQVAALALASHFVLAADRVPRFDVEPSCRAAGRASIAVAGRTTDSCRTDERAARTELEQTWTGFSADDKSHCSVLARMGGAPSYVELQSCLEISRDARRIVRERARADEADGETTGAGRAAAPKSQRR